MSTAPSAPTRPSRRSVDDRALPRLRYSLPDGERRPTTSLWAHRLVRLPTDDLCCGEDTARATLTIVDSTSWGPRPAVDHDTIRSTTWLHRSRAHPLLRNPYPLPHSLRLPGPPHHRRATRALRPLTSGTRTTGRRPSREARIVVAVMTSGSARRTGALRSAHVPDRFGRRSSPVHPLPEGSAP